MQISVHKARGECQERTHFNIILYIIYTYIYIVNFFCYEIDLLEEHLYHHYTNNHLSHLEFRGEA